MDKHIPEIIVSVDGEFTGRIPGPNSMISPHQQGLVSFFNGHLSDSLGLTERS